MRVVVVGAGPCGSRTAELCATEGHEVTLLEEHDHIGVPVQCTGIVSPAIAEAVRVPDAAVRMRIRRARIISPSGIAAEVRFAKPEIVLDRRRFDVALAKRAERAGARILTGTRFTGMRGQRAVATHDKRRISLDFDRLVGADGPFSTVARTAGLPTRRWWSGIQARVRHANKGIVEFYPQPCAFGWIVPESRTVARIGALAPRQPRTLFDQLMRQRAKDSEMLERQGGCVPLHEPGARIEQGTVALLGDAAGQVKATTFGGIVPGLMAAACYAESLAHDDSYTRRCNQRIGRGLWAHRMLRDRLDRFTAADYDRLVSLCASPAAASTLGSVDRDHLFTLGLAIIRAEPRLLWHCLGRL